MIRICDEEDCPLHVDNSWRKERIKKIELAISEKNLSSLDLKFLKDIHFLHDQLQQLKTIPDNCMMCKYKKEYDGRAEIIAGMAKEELLCEYKDG